MNIINNTEDLYYTRIKNYKKNIKKIQSINSYQCLISNKSKNKFYEYKLSQGTIFLKKQIGSKSRYGVIFLTKSKFSDLMFATKLMPRNYYNYNEIIISQNMSKNTLQDKNPHFLLVYKYIYCNDTNNNNLPDIIKKKQYYIAINELADGNYKNFLDFNKDENLTLNAYKQIMLSVLSFHHFTNGYYHNDCHFKNFLFHKIKKGGYFHYNIYGKDIYIENLGYIWMIWDFGLTKTETDIYKYNKLNDYFRINKILVEKYNSNFFNYTTDSNTNSIKYIVNELNDLSYIYKDLFGNSDKKIFELFFFKQQNLFMIDMKKPDNIINKKPYIIV